MEKANAQSAFQPSSTPSKPSREMHLSLDVNKIPRGRRNPKIDKESDHQVQAKQSPKYHDEKLKGKGSVFQPSSDVRNDLPQSANNGRSIYAKTLGKSQQRSVQMTARSQSEELVRYMSNVPGFLQRMDKGENIQDKALNVGVLDWGRLEKFKGNQKLVAHSGGNSRLSASSKSNVRAPSTFLSVDSGESSSRYSSHKMHENDGSSKSLKPSMHKFSRSQDFESTSKSCLEGQKVSGRNYRSFGRTSIDAAVTEKGKRRDLDQKGPPKLLSSSLDSGYGDDRRHQTMGTSDIKVARYGLFSSSSFGAPTLKTKDCEATRLSNDKKSGNRKVKNTAGEEAPQEPTSLVSPGSESGEKVVLLVPRKCSGSRFSEEPRAPLPSGVDTSSSTNPCKDGELSSAVPCNIGLYSAKPITKPPSLENLKVAKGYDSESSSVMDEETADEVARKDSHPSPNRRFTFSLGRLTRSFSLKESSTTPHFSSGYKSVKSGPVTSQSSAGLDIPKAEKARGPSRARSSPLRRLLDPLFKSKASSSSEREKSKEIPNPLESKQLESVQGEIHEASYTQAILQVSVKNGLPLFKFLIDNVAGKANILAATKNVSSPSKSSSGCNSYTFYAIDEIKKRSGGWMINSGSSKDNKRGCDYTYNVIGQMNINSSPVLGLTGENLTGHELVSEHVLFGLELQQKGETSPKLRSGRELGAVVVRTHSGNTALIQKQQGDEDEQSNSSVTVILPAAVHGLPDKGAPWPLIQRWRSGGSCDCGGWDVGCGLCVLSVTAQVASNGFELFAEGGGKEEDKKPVFVLRSVEKGMYSIEFNRRISLLQAFFISVTVVRSQKSSDFVDLASFANEPPTAKFAPCPPLSPVGRV